MTQSIVFSAEPTGATPPAAETPPAGDRPAWLPENFKTPEDFAASYKELQAKLTTQSQGTQQDPPPAQEETAEQKAAREAAETEQSPEEKAAAEAAAAAGVDMGALEAEFAKDGKLADETYAKLEKAGFPKSVVDEFITYRQQSAEKVFEVVGGREQFGKMADWARANYKPEQLKAYNEAVDSKDAGRIDLALRALKADFDKAKGVVPTFVKPTSGNPNAGGVYESMSQFLADQANPLYATDPAFRAKVADKLSRSKI